MDKKWTVSHTVATVGIPIFIFLFGLLIPNDQRLLGWLLTMLFLALFIMVAGHGTTGLWRGALIDDRNKMSLSRLQMILWTIIILAAYFTAGLANLKAQQPDPLSTAIPEELWILMGISTTSLVASPLAKSNKKVAQPDDTERQSTLDLMTAQGVNPAKVDNKGLIIVNKNPADAQWSDLFKGEETGNAALLDIAKIQMFYFTLILVLAYGVVLGGTLAKNQPPISTLPDMDTGMIALLGISHAGYLTNKVTPHSKPK